MLKKKLNKDWEFRKGSPTLMSALTGSGQYDSVRLPHDAMVHEDRTPDTENGPQTGFWPGGSYTYRKMLYIPEDWRDKTVIIEFEGVYETSMVYINDNLAGVQHHGYSGFYVNLDKYLNYGEDNELLVIANNDAEKNSRWYSGSGIYRNVNLLVGNRIHIAEDGIKITTPSVSEEYAVADIGITIRNLSRNRREKIKVITTVYSGNEQSGSNELNVTMFPCENEKVRQNICVKSPKLWDCDHPDLYRCNVRLYAGNELLDEADELFGFRRLELDAEHGLRINGKQVKLRGACIHHDNGIIGAATYEKAEERRCRQLKEAGFNSIRSAHHPMSKAMLDACDKYGILVMDELSDMWTKHKNGNDYALSFSEDAGREVRRMVAKDFNHPCVILYSTGNEIPEIGTPRGAQINRHICNLLHDLDPFRYTTNAINGMLALGGQEEKAGAIFKDISGQQEAGHAGEADSEEGASALNSMMGFMVGDIADQIACHPAMTEIIEEAGQAMDIIGLNYLTGRHELEKKLHPNQTVLGTETFPADIARLWDIVERNDHVLGDYTWTGYDYLGEAGCGIFYYDGTQNFSGVYPDRAAYIGDIDLVGYRRPVSYLREIVFGLRKDPYIAVERVDRYGMSHSQTAWMLKDNIASWTWPGYEGKPAIVDVYSPAEEVELFLNGKSLGKKPAGKANKYTATFEITYEPGDLEAVSRNDGEETGRFILRTADPDVRLSLACEEKTLKADGEDLAFVIVKLTDKNGTENLYEQKKVSVSVTGAGTLIGFGNADPRAVGSYDDTVWDTYNGYAMAVIRSDYQSGKIRAEFTAEGCASASVEIEVEDL